MFVAQIPFSFVFELVCN